MSRGRMMERAVARSGCGRGPAPGWAERLGVFAESAELTEATLDLPGYELAGFSMPKQGLGGDAYHWSPRPDGVRLSVADVMGMDTKTGRVADEVTASLHDEHLGDLDEALQRTQRALWSELGGTGFVSVFSAELDAGSGRLAYADAGHGLAVVVAEDGSTQRLTSRGLPVGISLSEAWSVFEVRLLPGDALVCVSDGLADLYADLDAMVIDLAAAVAGESAFAAAERVLSWVRDRAVTDDVTAVVLRRRV